MIFAVTRPVEHVTNTIYFCVIFSVIITYTWDYFATFWW